MFLLWSLWAERPLARRSRLRVDYRNVVAEAVTKTSHWCSHSLSAAVISDISSQRDKLANQPCNSSLATATKSHWPSALQISSLRPTQRRDEPPARRPDPRWWRQTGEHLREPHRASQKTSSRFISKLSSYVGASYANTAEICLN